MWWLVSLAMWLVGRVEWLPLPRPSTSHVDRCPRSCGPNQLNTWPTGQGVGPADWPLGPFDLRFGPRGPRVKYNPVVMMILTFD
jgi:hypothetical protein